MALELTWAKQRRIIIVLILLGVFFLFVGAGYLLWRSAPSCFDGQQNGKETGIDCGGGCALICKDDTAPLVVDWVRLFKIREGEYAVLARVDNPNLSSIVYDAPYTFELKNEQGVVVASRTGTTFVPARKTFVVYQGTIRTDALPTSATFRFEGAPSWYLSEYTEPQLMVIDKKLTNEETLPRLDAVIRNENIVDVDNATLSAVIYDDEGNALQVSQTYIPRIQSKDSASVAFTWPNPIPLKARVCENPIDVSLVIDRSGSMEYLGANPPQPLTDVKDAANYFASELSKFDRASVVSFGNEASSPVDAPLSANLTAVKDAINAISIIQPGNLQNTNFADGILKGATELASPSARSGAGKILIALTDGVATRPLQAGNAKYPETYALEVAKQAKDAGVRVFTIGLGKDLNQEFLKQVASAPTDFFLAPTADDLQKVYRDIGLKMCKRKPTALEIFISIPPKK